LGALSLRVTWIVQPVLGHFEVIVGQLGPKKALDLAFRCGIIKIFHEFGNAPNQPLSP
jgi:hypothetical protein